MVTETKLDDYKLLIGGKMVDAASGETFDSYNPATGQAFVPKRDPAQSCSP